MEKIKLLNIQDIGDEQYKKEWFIKIKKDKEVYGLLLSNGFDDDNIKKYIGNCICFYKDYYFWKNITTYQDVLRTGVKFKYQLIFDGVSTQRISDQIDAYREYNDYNSKFVVKDFDDQFNNVLFKNLDNPSLKSKIKKELTANRWIYLTGAMRSGRTYCSIALINSSAASGNDNLAFIDSAKEIKFLSDLIFKEKNLFEKKLNELKQARTLVIDGFGNEYINDVIRDSIVIPLLQERATNNLVTIFTSDFSVEDVVMLYSNTKGASSIRAKQLKNILLSKIKEEIVTSTQSIY